MKKTDYNNLSIEENKEKEIEVENIEGTKEEKKEEIKEEIKDEIREEIKEEIRDELKDEIKDLNELHDKNDIPKRIIVRSDSNYVFESNRKYFTICIYAFCLILISVLTIAMILNMGKTKAIFAGVFKALTPFLVAMLDRKSVV